jgi:hypothetical protein
MDRVGTWSEGAEVTEHGATRRDRWDGPHARTTSQGVGFRLHTRAWPVAHLSPQKRFVTSSRPAFRRASRSQVEDELVLEVYMNGRQQCQMKHQEMYKSEPDLRVNIVRQFREG